MGEAFWLWFMRPLAELAYGIAVIAVVLTFYFLFVVLPTIIKQARCKHERWFENRQCHAVCRNCGKDLGFIGTWREKQKEQHE